MKADNPIEKIVKFRFRNGPESSKRICNDRRGNKTFNNGFGNFDKTKSKFE